jgi:hypothetical protein
VALKTTPRHRFFLLQLFHYSIVFASLFRFLVQRVFDSVLSCSSFNQGFTPCLFVILNIVKNCFSKSMILM